MVWILKKEGSDVESKELKLLPGKEYVVGRKDSDIVLTSDQSISRTHAIIKVTSKVSEMLGPGDCRTTVAILVDHSKYGTSINGEKVATGVDTVLNCDDLILFGVYENRWRVKRNPFVCCTSCLVGEEKASVQRTVSKLGGQIVNEWTPQCSLLVMNKLTVTIKVVNVLVSLGNIVTPKYLEDYYEAAKNNGKDPDPNNYVPPLEKSNVLEDSVDFTPNTERKTVFRGITFISFASKQFKKLKFTLMRTGAELKLEDAARFRLVASIANNDVCVLQPPKNLVPSDFESKLDTFLKKYSKRSVSEGEVGLAVVYCSRTKYCNPSLNKSDTNSFRGSLLDTQQRCSSYDTIYDTQTSSIKTEQMDTFEVDTEVESIRPSVQKRSEDCRPGPSYYDKNISSSIVSEVNEKEVESSFEPSVPNVETPKLQSPLLESKCEPMEYEEEGKDSTLNYDESGNSRLNYEKCGNSRTNSEQSINLRSNYEKSGNSRSNYKKSGNSQPNVIKNETVDQLHGHNVKKIINNRNDDDREYESGRGSVVIRLMSLVRKKNSVIRNETNGETIKNFKRFKKVFPKGSRISNKGDETKRRLELVRSSAVVQSQPFLDANGNSQNNGNEIDCTDSANVFDWD